MIQQHSSHTQPIHSPHPSCSMIEMGERQLPIFCPQCSERIQLTRGLCGNRLVDAIMLQAERVGAELHCEACHHTFVYHQVRTLGESLNGPLRKPQ